MDFKSVLARTSLASKGFDFKALKYANIDSTIIVALVSPRLGLQIDSHIFVLSDPQNIIYNADQPVQKSAAILLEIVAQFLRQIPLTLQVSTSKNKTTHAIMTRLADNNDYLIVGTLSHAWYDAEWITTKISKAITD